MSVTSAVREDVTIVSIFSESEKEAESKGTVFKNVIQKLHTSLCLAPLSWI